MYTSFSYDIWGMQHCMGSPGNSIFAKESEQTSVQKLEFSTRVRMTVDQ